jgi:hypothetical protein
MLKEEIELVGLLLTRTQDGSLMWEESTSETLFAQYWCTWQGKELILRRCFGCYDLSFHGRTVCDVRKLLKPLYKAAGRSAVITHKAQRQARLQQMLQGKNKDE